MLIKNKSVGLNPHSHFNTSHVNVNLTALRLSTLALNFNTSHVNVNQAKDRFTLLISSISIHLMLMLILLTRKWGECFILHFNTSHVNVNRKQR